MNCVDWEAKLTDFALGELSEAERPVLEQHLAECAVCRAELEAIRVTVGRLQESFTTEPLPSPETPQRKRPAVGISWNKAALAAGALLAVSTLVFLYSADEFSREFFGVSNPSPPVEESGTTFSLASSKTSDTKIADAPESEIQVSPIPLSESVVSDTDEFEALQADPKPMQVRAPWSGSGAGSARSHGRAFGGHRNLVARKERPGAKGDSSPELSTGPAYPGTEEYLGLPENSFLAVKEHPLSTFSIDVDRASYSNVRRFLNQGQLPPREAVRIEEFVNYFAYSYPQPSEAEPFSVNLAVGPSPWSTGNLLLRVGIKGREVARESRPPCNLVFLIDVSGSMESSNKLPLLKSCMKALVADLREQDRVGIVTYAGEAGIALPSTSCEQKSKILDALEALQSGGSTNGGAGIQEAYEMASSYFHKGGVNRVVLATDGDFNVGITDDNDLVRLIVEEAKGGIFLTVLGFGMDNLKDARLEALADKGNGHYGYIDSFQEGRKMLVTEAGSTLVTIAKDVKIQIEFNPEKIQAFRLLGYENRLLAHKDFNDDKKDAGEVGAGHTVTALYELVPAGSDFAFAGVDPLRYQQQPKAPAPTSWEPTAMAKSAELLTVKLRYKEPEGEASKLIARSLSEQGVSWEKADREFRFAAAVAAFGMILRDSPHKGDASFDRVLSWAEFARDEDNSGDRAEFLNLVQAAKALKK